MKKRTLREQFERWRASRIELMREVDTLRKDNVRLQQRLAVLQQAKDQAETQAEERRREKESLRARVSAQNKTLANQERLIAELGTKITELRAEIDKAKRTKKK